MTAGHLNHELKYEKNQRSRKRRMKKMGMNADLNIKKVFSKREGERGTRIRQNHRGQNQKRRKPKEQEDWYKQKQKTKSQRMTSTYLERDMEKGRERLRYVCADWEIVSSKRIHGGDIWDTCKRNIYNGVWLYRTEGKRTRESQVWGLTTLIFQRKRVPEEMAKKI